LIYTLCELVSMAVYVSFPLAGTLSERERFWTSVGRTDGQNVKNRNSEGI
jgi:hypothetical protein